MVQPSAYMVENKKFNLNKRSMADFQASMKHYLKNFNYDKTRENELNEKEFVFFWADLYAIFAKIDRDGDGEIAIVECVELLDEKADKFGLTKAGLSQSRPIGTHENHGNQPHLFN